MGCVKHLHTEGKRRTRTYATWSCMKYRCNNPNSSDYQHYGARGIRVCERWSESFEAFLEDMGERPQGMQIDRIDVNGDYSPENCRWVTPSENSDNRRSSRRYAFNGETLSVMGWAKKLNIPWPTLDWRLKRWPLERALTEVRR